MINADEIAGILKQQIASFTSGVQEDEVGTVLEVGANLAPVHAGLGLLGGVCSVVCSSFQGVTPFYSGQWSVVSD